MKLYDDGHPGEEGLEKAVTTKRRILRREKGLEQQLRMARMLLFSKLQSTKRRYFLAGLKDMQAVHLHYGIILTRVKYDLSLIVQLYLKLY